MIPRAALACIAFVVAGLPWLVEGARAKDMLFAQGYGARAVEPCGPFAAELGAALPRGPCSRFGGRVRVDLGAQQPSLPGTSYGASRAAVRSGDASEHAPGSLDLPGRLESGVTRSHLRVPSQDAAGSFDPASAR